MNNMRRIHTQRRKVTRVLKVEDLENRALMASDLAAALQALVTASSRQQATADVGSLRGSAASDIAASRLSINESGGIEIRNARGTGLADLSRLSNARIANRIDPSLIVRSGGTLQTNGLAQASIGGRSDLLGLPPTGVNSFNRFNLQPSNATIGATDADGADNSSIDSRLNSFNLIANRISTGQRPLADRVTTPRSLASDFNAGSDVSLRARDIVFGSDFATNLNGSLSSQNSLSANSGVRTNLSLNGLRTPSGFVLTNAHQSEHPTALDRIFLSRAGRRGLLSSDFGANLSNSLVSRNSLSANVNPLLGSSRTGGFMLTNVHSPHNPTAADRIFLSRAGVTARDAVFGSDFASNLNTSLSSRNTSLSQAGGLRTAGGFMLTNASVPHNPTVAERIFMSRA